MTLRLVKSLAAALALGFTVSTAAAPRGAAASITLPDYTFGVVEANLAVTQAARLGIGWTRVPLPWASLEPEPGEWNFAYTDNDQTLLALAQHHIVPVGVVETVPAWASANPQEAPDGVPKGLYLPWNNPGNLWGQYMYSLARHYAGLINTWIIGNEISIRSGPQKSWDGSVAQMAQMIRVAYLAVHAANPAAEIQAPGAPYWYDHGATTEALLNALARLPGARQHHDFLDGINVHLYNTLQWNAMIYGQYRAMLRQHGLGSLPIWLTETNAAPGAPEQPGTTPLDQADFLVENLAASLQYVPEAEVYEMTDYPPGSGRYGILTPAGKPTLAYEAVKTAIQWFQGTRFLHAEVLPYEWQAVSKPAIVALGGVRRLVFVVWDQGFEPTTVSLPAYSPTATVTTALGATRVITAHRGHFVLALSPATVHAASPPTAAPIGGPPLIVTQTVGLGEAGTPTTPPPNSPAMFAGPAPALVAHRGQETAVVNPTTDTVRITTAQGNVTVGGWGTGPGELLGPSGVAIGPQGWVYVTNAGANDVVVYAPSGRVVATWGGFGSAGGKFNGPSGIAIGTQGTVYVADTLNQRVQAFTPTGRFLGQTVAAWPAGVRVLAPGEVSVQNGLTGAWTDASFARVTAVLPLPQGVTALALGPDGRYAAATQGGQVAIYASSGQRQALWTIPPAYGNRLPPKITALCWVGSTLDVVDGRYNRVLALDTRVLPSVGSAAPVSALPLNPQLLLGPSALAVSPEGILWIANTDRNALTAVTPSGTVVAQIPVRDGIRGVALLGNQDLAVTGYYGDSLTVMTPSGKVLWRAGSPGHGLDALDHPTTVLGLSNGEIAVWDTGNDRAVIYSPSGSPVNWIAAPPGSTALALWAQGQLAWATPEGLDVMAP
ncbi:MAG: NHL repeat-containing protein [Firmicutes bacterium]|nr:NHL repeat-containing protein [Bacillota bacterium]